MNKSEIKQALHNALLADGKMEQALYEFELQENVADWKEGLIDYNEDFVFALTANNGSVAMILITKEDEIFINENAREKLKFFWKKQYKTNIELLLPNAVTDLSNGFFSLTGVKFKEQ